MFGKSCLWLGGKISNFFLSIFERGFLCNPGCPRTHSADQGGLKLRDMSTSASQMVGFKVYVTMPGINFWGNMDDFLSIELTQLWEKRYYTWIRGLYTACFWQVCYWAFYLKTEPFKKNSLFYVCVYKCFSCLYVHAFHVCLVPTKARRGHLTHWAWS